MQHVGPGAHDIGDIVISGPVRRGETDFVAFVEQCFGQVVQHLLGADADRKVRASVAAKTQRLDVLEEGIQQRIGTAIAAVLAAVVRERFAGCRVDVIAGQEIRHADGETDDVAAGSLQLLRLFGNDHDRAGFGAADTLGELGHGFLEWGTETANPCDFSMRRCVIRSPRIRAKNSYCSAIVRWHDAEAAS